MNIYRKISNPLNDDNIIENILDAYCNNYNLYDGLTKSHSKSKINGRYTVRDLDEFYLLIFNDWKSTIHKIREADYLSEPYKSQIIVLDNFLQKTNPTSYAEVMEIISGKKTNDEELKSIIDKLRWNSLGEQSSWEHIDSACIKVSLYKRQPVEHRLYLNCDSTKTHFIARKFIEKCKEIKSKYYFKYDPYGDRDDTIVIYSDTEHLPYYIEMLNEIIKENNLESSIHKPPLLTGKIGNYIGYGSEPQNGKDGLPQSFNTKREEHLESCIKEQTAQFIKKNLSRRIVGKQGTTSYRDFLIDYIIRKTREQTLRALPGDDKRSINAMGYTKKEVNSSFFDIALRRELEKQLEAVIENYRKESYITPIKVPFGKGTIRVSHFTFEEVFKDQVRLICKKSKTYKESLKKRILETTSLYDIDEDNYAVDLSKCKLLGKGEEDAYNDTSNSSASKKKQSVDEQPKVAKKRFEYKPMTDEEIEAARRRLGM